MELSQIKFVARDLNSESEPHTFVGYRLESGEVVVHYDSTNDGWFASVEDVEPCGGAVVESWTDTGETVTWTKAEIRDSVRGSAGEFGLDAVPATLRPLVNTRDR